MMHTHCILAWCTGAVFGAVAASVELHRFVNAGRERCLVWATAAVGETLWRSR